MWISIPICRAGGARRRSDAGPKAGPGRAVSRIRNPAVYWENRKAAGRQRWSVWGIRGGGGVVRGSLPPCPAGFEEI